MFTYKYVPAGSAVMLPPMDGPFKCAILADREISEEFRKDTSRLLIEAGCRWAMAWGQDGTLWDDSLDDASLSRFETREAPDDQFVHTTWHDDLTLEELLSHAKNVATEAYDGTPLEDLLVLDLGPRKRAGPVFKAYHRA